MVVTSLPSERCEKLTRLNQQEAVLQFLEKEEEEETRARDLLTLPVPRNPVASKRKDIYPKIHPEGAAMVHLQEEEQKLMGLIMRPKIIRIDQPIQKKSAVPENCHPREETVRMETWNTNHQRTR